MRSPWHSTYGKKREDDMRPSTQIVLNLIVLGSFFVAAWLWLAIAGGQ